jgi:hypothetical protein
VVSPIDAEVTLGGEDLGVMPITVRVKEGESKTISVWKAGFHRKNVTIDGSRAREVVRLTTLAMAKPAALDAKSAPAASAASKPPEAIPEVDPKKSAPAGSAATAPSDKPADFKPADGKATESKPADGKATESKPAEAPPSESKPAESKPADSKGSIPPAGSSPPATPAEAPKQKPEQPAAEE